MRPRLDADLVAHRAGKAAGPALTGEAVVDSPGGGGVDPRGVGADVVVYDRLGDKLSLKGCLFECAYKEFQSVSFGRGW